jgi:Flp pilus assembly protein TadD
MRRARELAPHEGDIAYLASQIHTRLGQDEAAERALRDAVAAAPLHVGACNDLAWRLAASGRDLDLALQLARRAVRVRDEGTLLDTLGFVLLARGEPEEAAQVLAEAVARKPDDPGFRYRLGLALARTGHEAEARDAFEQALSHGPFPEAEQARAELARLTP